jgi:DNA-binding MarR family transcriptional regulator
MLVPTRKVLKRVLLLSIAATRGGLMRFRILEMIGEKPRNTNEIANILGVDYKTAQHHVRVLEKSGLAVSSKDKYGNLYSLSTLLKENKDLLKEVSKDLGKSR